MAERPQLHIDLGAGDGRYVLERARHEPGTLFAGIEPNHAGLIEASRRAGKAPGGNALFVLGALESLPGPFAGRASSLTILFPWGSLLRAVAAPEPRDLAKLASVCRPGARIEVVTALDAAADAGELGRLGMSGFSFEQMAEGWRAAGFDELKLEILGADHQYQTTWWRKIRQRENRSTVRLSASTP